MSTLVFSSIVATILSAPLLRAQALLQTQDLIPKLRFGTPKLKGIIDTLKRVRKEEGGGNLWRGAVPLYVFVTLSLTAKSLLESSIEKFETYETPEKEENGEKQEENLDENGEPKKVKITRIVITNTSDNEGKEGEKVLNDENRLIPRGVPLSLFSVGCSILSHPFKVLFIRMATDYSAPKQYSGMFNCMSQLVKAGGFKALYRGFVPLTTYYVIQRNINSYLLDENLIDLRETGKEFVRDLALFPLVVIANRMIMQTGNPLATFKNMRECISTTYKSFGARGFYSGFQVTLFLYCLKLIPDVIDIDDDEEDSS